MVGVRFEYRIEIQTGHAQLREPVEPLLNAAQISAEIIVVADLSLRVRLPGGFTAPIVPQDAAIGKGGRILRRGETLICPGEAIGEDLVHHAAGQPIGGPEALFVAGELPHRAGRGGKGGGGVGLADEIPTALSGFDLKAVPGQPDRRRRIPAVPPFVAVIRLSRPEHAVQGFRPAVRAADQIGSTAPYPAGQEDPEQHRTSLLDSAERGTVLRIAGIEQFMDRESFRLRHAFTCLSSVSGLLRRSPVSAADAAALIFIIMARLAPRGKSCLCPFVSCKRPLICS